MSTATSKKTSKAKPVQIRKPPVIFPGSQKYLKELSQELGCPVLTYFKPPNGNIWSEDLYALLECLTRIGKVDKLALYVRSNGGSGMVSLRIIHLLRSFADKLIILAPSECASAATMLALGCDEIYMGPLSSLSPVDSSLTHSMSPTDSLNRSVSVSMDELWRVLKLWKEADAPETQFVPSKRDAVQSTKDDLTFGYIAKDTHESESPAYDNPYKYLYKYIHPLVFGAVDRYSSLSVRLCQEILQYHLQDQKKVEAISHKLNYDYPAHGYPITLNEAKKIGLNVVSMSSKVLHILHSLGQLYNELAEELISDYDNAMYHDHSIYSIAETLDLQVTYQQDYDKFYREAEKRYITLNDQSGWFKTEFKSKAKNSKNTKEEYTTTKIFF